MALLRQMAVLGMSAGLILAHPAAAQTLPFDQPDDLVEALVVKARTPGPAWWKVSDADTTVWILGSPGLLPQSVNWDDSMLKRRLTGANRLILPPREHLPAALQIASGLTLVKGSVDRPLSARLPSPLLKRLKDSLDNALPAYGTGEQKVWVQVSVYNTGVEFDARKFPKSSPGPDLFTMQQPPKTVILALAALKLADAPLGKVVDDPASRAEALATDLKIPRTRAGTYDSVGALRIRMALPESVQQACLTGALDVLDAKGVRVAAKLVAVRAWSEGDVPAAMGRRDRFDMLGACAAPPAANAMTARNITADVSAIRAELRRNGHAVAVIDLGDLLQVGGVLDQLGKVRGVTITAPDVLDD
ncbi:MAG: GumN family protein [Caulobacteraceae bacterium]|nr:GumN family protein [Caulobacteraceae bacterium]